MARGLSTAYPLCCVAMELAAQLEHRQADLALSWVPRDKNSEADRLADGDARGFSPSMRRGASYTELKWLVLDALLRTGGDFYRGLRDRRSTPPEAAGRQKAKRRKLREREPW